MNEWQVIKPYKDIIFDDKYRINIKGEIINRHTGKQYNQHVGYDKRPRINLADIYGVRRSFYVYRLLVNTFKGEVGDYIVHHDNIPTDVLDLDHLVICTQKDNVRFSIESNEKFNRRGENSATWKSIFTNDNVREICKTLEETPDIKYSDILTKVGIDVNKNTLDMMTKIRTGKLWTHISKDYNISKRPPRSMKTYDNYRDHILSLLEKSYTTREIANNLDIQLESKKDRDRFWKYVGRLRDSLQSSTTIERQSGKLVIEINLPD